MREPYKCLSIVDAACGQFPNLILARSEFSYFSAEDKHFHSDGCKSREQLHTDSKRVELVEFCLFFERVSWIHTSDICEVSFVNIFIRHLEWLILLPNGWNGFCTRYHYCPNCITYKLYPLTINSTLQKQKALINVYNDHVRELLKSY